MTEDKKEMKQGKINCEALALLFQQSNNHKEFLRLISQSLLHSTGFNVSEEEKASYIQQVVHLFLTSQMEKNFKKGVLKCITNLPEEWRSHVITAISRYFDEMFLKVSEDYETLSFFFENIVIMLTNVVIATEIFNSKFSQIILLYENLIKNLHAQLRNETIKVKEIRLVDTLHVLVQSLIVFVDESCKYKTLITFPHSLYESIQSTMTCRKLCLNTISNCGLLLVTLDCNFFDVSSSLQMLKHSSQSSPMECLAICHGVLVNWSSLDVSNSSSDHGHLLIFILDALRCIFVNNMNDSLAIIGLLKIVLMISKKIELRKYNVPNEYVRYLVNLLLSHLDHFLNPVKNLSKEALNQFLSQKDESIILECFVFVESTRRIDRKMCIILIALSSEVPFSRILSSYQTVIYDLRNAAKNVISSNYVCQAYLSLMISSYSNENMDEWYNLWIDPLLLDNDNYNLLLELILVPAVKLSPFIFQKIITSCRNVDKTNYPVIVKCLLEIKPNDISYSIDLSDFSEMSLNSVRWKNLLPYELMKRVICESNSVNALKTASLLIENWKGKEILTNEEINLLKLFIDSQMAPKVSEFRYKFLNVLKQLFMKISNNPHTSSCTNFVEWTISHCENNLFPGASYERRFTALRILTIIIDAKVWPVSKTNMHCTRILFQCLKDPFEENKEVAKNILISTFLRQEALNNEDFRTNLYWEIFDMILGIRFAEHDTAAYLLEILCCFTFCETHFTRIAVVQNLPFTYDDVTSGNHCIEDSYSFYLNNLVSSLKVRFGESEQKYIARYPLHGLLRVIRHLLKRILLKNQNETDMLRWKKLINQIVQISISCNEYALAIVSHASPEGHLPSEEILLAKAQENTYYAAQQVLLCNWRMVKEASLLLGDLVENCSINSDSENAHLNKSVFLQIGNHLKTLIHKIRHKGSFKQVYIALFQFCRRCWSVQDHEISDLPKRWLTEIKSEIITNDQQLCLTRRGAGVPCIVLAILCTELNDKRKYGSNLLKMFMEDMFEILNNQDISVESKVHAMNILCELFKHKDMSEEVNIFIEKAVIISINGFKSTVWSERNTSNLLLSSILTRIFGVSRSRTEISWKNKMTGKMFFQKYPALYDVFIFHLEQSKDENVGIQSALYPILLIFARLYPSHHDEWNVTFQLNAFIPLIYNCSQNSVFKIRQLAVQAIIPLITPAIYVDHLHKIWSHLVLPLPENTKHGLLLQFDGLLHNKPEFGENGDDGLFLIFIKVLLEAEFFFQENHSLVVKEKLLMILSTILGRYYSRLDLANMKIYPVDENHILKGNNHHLNEQSYIAKVHNFNVGLQYLISVKNHAESEYVHQLENKIEEESTEVTTNVVLEFITKIVSDDELENENHILQHLIPDDENKKVFAEMVLRSNVIQQYVFNGLVDDKNNHLFEIIYILPNFLQYFSETEWVIEVFLHFCEKHHNNSKLMTPFLKSVDILLEKLDILEEKCLSIMKLLLTTARKPFLDHQRSWKKFFLKYFRHPCWKSDENLVLSIWTYVIENLSNVEEDEFIYFEGLFHNFDIEEHLLLNKVLHGFSSYLESNSLLLAVGLFSWIVKDLGVIFDDSEKNYVFFGDLSDYFEDQLLVCKISMIYLNRLLKLYPSLLSGKLPVAQVSWLSQQSAFNEEELVAFTLHDMISIILQKFEKWRFHSPSFIFSREETVEQQVISCKLSFLNSLISKSGS